MTGFDYVVLAVMALSVLVSVMRGALREVVSLASWVVSGYLAVRFAPSVSRLFPSVVTSPEVRVAAAFIVVLVICLLVFSVMCLLFSQLIAKGRLAGADRTHSEQSGRVVGRR